MPRVPSSELIEDTGLRCSSRYTDPVVGLLATQIARVGLEFGDSQQWPTQVELQQASSGSADTSGDLEASLQSDTPPRELAFPSIHEAGPKSESTLESPSSRNPLSSGSSWLRSAIGSPRETTVHEITTEIGVCPSRVPARAVVVCRGFAVVGDLSLRSSLATGVDPLLRGTVRCGSGV